MTHELARLAVWTCLAVAAPGEDVWPGFLGAGSSGVDPRTIPADWGPERNVAWKAELPGYGQSSPVVWKDRVYVTSVVGPMKDECVVSCLSLTEGGELWRKGVESSDKVESTLYVSRAAPTPVADDAGLIAFFESGDVVAYDHEGRLRWQRSLAKDYGKFQNKFGLGASLAQDDDAVYLLADNEGPSYLVSLDKQDGSTNWKTARDSRMSWSSPTLVSAGGKAWIVVSSQGGVDLYDPSGGQLVSSYDEVGGNTAATPIGYDDGVFLVGASPGPSGENQAEAVQSNLAMKIVMKDDKPTLEVLWRADTTSTFASPIVYRGRGYWVNRTGAMSCFDLSTGKRLSAGRLAESTWATPVGIGDRIYFFGRKGQTTVVAAEDEFKILGTNRLWQEEAAPEGEQGGQFGGRTQYGVAVVNGSLLVRTGDVLYCIRGGE